MGTPLRIRPARAVLAGVVLAALPMASFAFVSVGVSITVAPPALPVYVQPACPGVGYIWTPGYWAWEDGDYYWVPGTWVLAPSPGFLWTPGYWGWGGGLYAWHPGYWGPHVGFYGGINYGYGYTGVGFAGGYWRGRDFYYNRSVSNLGGLHVTNVYNRTVVNNITINRVSFNGGDRGTHARPSAHELAAEHDRHVDFTPVQREHEHMAFGNHDLRASVNGGRPRIAATARPAVFTGRGVMEARSAGAPYHGGDHRGGDHGASGERGGSAGGRGADVHAGGPNHNVEPRGGAAHGAQMRADRPPGATGGGSAAIRGSTGGGAGAGRGAEMHAGDRGPSGGGAGLGRGAEMHAGDRGPSSGGAGVGRGAGAEPHAGAPARDSQHLAAARNDRPPGAGGGNSMPQMNQTNQMRGEHNAAGQGGHPGGGSAMPRQFNAGGGQPGPRPQVHAEAPRSQPRTEAPHVQAAPRTEAPRMQATPRMEGPRPQAGRQMQSAPHQQAAPRPEMRRGGGGEPHGQDGSHPQMRGQEQNHGRR